MESVTFDLETLKLAEDLEGGFGALRAGEGGISCLTLWSSAAGRPFLFGEDDLPKAVAMIEAADCVLGFNSVNFDIPVLEGVTGESINVQRHVDLLQLIWDARGREKGHTLNECGERTVGWGKNGSALMAPQLAEDGRWIELVEYCLTDTILTLELFEFAQKNGGITGLDDELMLLDLPEWFPSLNLRGPK